MSPIRTLTGWGRTSSTKIAVLEPASRDELEEQFATIHAGKILAYGAGRSYGDQAIGTGGTCVMTDRLDAIISFKPDEAEIVVEAGAKFGDLLTELVPRGFMLPVNPGTGFVTIGGAIANDIHGKNHDADGSFGHHVNWIELLLADGSRRIVCREENPELFRATVGGSGMTGIILSASIRLMPVSGDRVRMTQTRMASLDIFLDELLEARENSRFFVGWIDALSRGKDFGRGILESAEFTDKTQGLTAPRRLRVPLDFPSVALNRWSVRAFNAMYFRHVPAKGRTSVIQIDKFLYPLDALTDWNRIYGRRGFDQFQCVIPDEGARTCVGEMLKQIGASRIGSFLGVIKTLGGPGEGHLSFPMRGITLALDLPRMRQSGSLIMNLQRMTVDFGGRVYLAKDSWLTPDLLGQMYPDLPGFREVLCKWDPEYRFDSQMAQRLRFRDDKQN